MNTQRMDINLNRLEWTDLSLWHHSLGRSLVNGLGLCVFLSSICQHFHDISLPHCSDSRNIQHPAERTDIHKWENLYPGHSRVAEPDFTKCNMFLDQHPCWSWNNFTISTNQIWGTHLLFISSLGLRSLPSDFRDNLWV